MGRSQMWSYQLSSPCRVKDCVKSSDYMLEPTDYGQPGEAHSSSFGVQSVYWGLITDSLHV